ncbi:phosphatase PAP2 family protein [Natranaerobius thermophilus]|uniref:Phosphoesterase PA-phosphatase related n=1 Tax=Natranaerobius thermophilus (strain ATCC BAA-1301 / DSM 18059 / JW/NM-WN-LF) TaxID=457570 RepID=B2A8H0_NATTJ|nr:phosphatase PAP2 family protein [Natranaerobius thermophilus]ACB85854.1 phosphoesterase PA-phosphatase related [Natranaerobius thermophilus JW/NM-WN-LF]
MIAELDKAIFQAFQSIQGTFPALDGIFIFIAGQSKYFMGILFLVGFILLFLNRYQKLQRSEISWTGLIGTMLIAALLVLIPIILSDFIRELVQRERPFVIFDLEPMIEQDIRPSLPSNHTAASFAIAGFFLVYFRNAFPFVALLAALVGIARIYTGIHFPLDILAGSVVGILPALLFLALSSRINYRGWSQDYLSRYRKPKLKRK